MAKKKINEQIEKMKNWLSRQKPQMTEKGREKLDQTKQTIPLGFERPETLAEQVARLVRSNSLAQAATAAGYDTFDDYDDFDIEDDVDPSTPYETVFEPGLNKEITRAEKQFIDAQKKRAPLPPKSKPKAPPKEPEAPKKPEEK